MTAYVGHYINLAAFERRLSAAVVRRIYDDANLGVVSADELEPISQLIKDAEAKFEGYCRGAYPLDALRLAKPSEAVRLVLDVAEALAAKRFPRAINRDWMALEQSVNAELKGLRTGVTRFDIVGSPEPPANVGGDLYVEGRGINDTMPEQPATFTRNGFGAF